MSGALINTLRAVEGHCPATLLASFLCQHAEVLDHEASDDAVGHQGIPVHSATVRHRATGLRYVIAVAEVPGDEPETPEDE